MKRILLEIDGACHPVQVGRVEQVDGCRSAIDIRTNAKLDRGRSCILRTQDGRALDCVISNFVSSEGNQIVELRCLGETAFLLGQS